MLQSMGLQSQTWLSNFTFTFHFHALEKEMAIQCSCLDNPREGGAWWAAIYGVAQSRTRLKRLSSSSSSNLLAVQGTPRSLLQHCCLEASVLWCSAFFTVQLSHPYTTTGKPIALTYKDLCQRFVIAFLPRSKCLLVSWLQSPSTVILEPKKIKPVPVSTVSASVYHEAMQPDAMILVFWMLSFKNQLFHSPVTHQETL